MLRYVQNVGAQPRTTFVAIADIESCRTKRKCLHMMDRAGQSNEPLVVQALEEAILFRQWCADGNPEPFRSTAGRDRSEDWARIREYRKLLQRARAKVITRRVGNGNTHPREVR